MAVYKNPAEVVPSIIRKWVADNIETEAPAVVINTDNYSDERCIAVQPLIMEPQGDGDVIVPSVIPKALVIVPGCQDGFLSFPLQPGDKVWIGYCKRSLEEFVFGTTAEQYEPTDNRIFGNTDVVVLGYAGQANTDLPLNPDNLELRYRDSFITITPENVITITNSQATIVMDGDQLDIDAPSGATINGATINSSGNLITASGTDLDALREAYNTHTHPVSGSTAEITPNQA